jgi:hypothetical protein
MASHTLVEVDKTHLNGIVKDIATSIIERSARIVEARAQKGGWEGWLQVELASALRILHGMQYDILREQPVYAASQRIDIWAQPVSGQSVPHLGVELKVESEYQTGVNKTLQERFKADILKCNVGPKPEFKTGHGTQMIAVGITSLVNDLQGYKEIAISTNQLICYSPLVVDNVHGIKNIYMIWWSKEFK